MIGQLKGILDSCNGDEVIVDVCGVGYQVTVSGSVLAGLKGVGAAVKFVIYTDVKENAISLFGFSSVMERQVFLLTKKVKGIGSKSAMNIVSSLGAEALLSAIGRGDTDALKRVSGIGKKTAERIIVELKEQVIAFVEEICGSYSGDADHPGRAGLAANIEVSSLINSRSNLRLSARQASAATMLLTPSIENDAMLALEKLGVHADKAKLAVAAALENNKDIKDSGELVRLSLSNL